jgi:hypothetical protein
VTSSIREQQDGLARRKSNGVMDLSFSLSSVDAEIFERRLRMASDSFNIEKFAAAAKSMTTFALQKTTFSISAGYRSNVSTAS